MMRNYKLMLVMGSLAVVLQSCVVADDRGRRADDRREYDRFVSCGTGHRLQVVDLDMSPDPVAEGQRIREWRVRLRADASGECRTRIRIVERTDNDLVGAERVHGLRPGMNAIEVEPLERYRFTRDEHCFRVLVDVEGTWRPVDAARSFCARRVAGRRWTLR